MAKIRPTAKIREAQKILKELGLPPAQYNEISALTFLALCGIKPGDEWSNAKNLSQTVSKGIMRFVFLEYGKQYAPNTRETVRRQVLHQFIQANLVDYNPDDPNLPTNSPRAHYALNEAALRAVKTFGTERWAQNANLFIGKKGSLLEIYQRNRSRKLIPVRIKDKTFILSPGKHNKVQAAIIEKFAPRFTPGASLLYLGDTAKKNLSMDSEKLTLLHIPVSDHDKLPDIILFDELRNRLFLIEAVTSHGPMSPKRVKELEIMMAACKAALIYVSAFPDISEFRKHIKDIAWETEVWIADIPDHMIHFNGDRFLNI